MTTTAVFDVDGTLTTGDTLLPFLRHACGAGALAAALGADWRRLLAMASTRSARDAAKATLIARLLTGVPHARLEELGEAYARRVFATRLRRDVVARLLWHQRRHDEVVLASASLATYVVPLGEHLGVDAVLATTLEVGADGRCTGRLEGGNVRAKEKAARVANHLRHRSGALWAYGDSVDDADLLAMADVAVLVGRTPLPTTPSQLTTSQ